MNGSRPRFLQGIFLFEGLGLDKPVPVADELSYVVPVGVTAQPLYFRGGNSADEMILVTLIRDGVPMRYFPIAAKGATHVSLRVVEDLPSDTVLQVFLAAPKGVVGTVVVDTGFVEI